jgi:hypothetical protein
MRKYIVSVIVCAYVTIQPKKILQVKKGFFYEPGLQTYN